MRREVPGLGHRPALTYRVAAGHELADAFEQRGRRRHVAISEIVPEGRAIDATRNAGNREDRLDLGREEQHAIRLMEEQGLLTVAVTGEQQTLPVRVPEGEREHAAEARHARRSPLLVRMHDGLGVGAGAERVPLRDELLAQRLKIVDLPVEDDLHRAVLVRHRLVSGGQIDDGQPPVREAHAALAVARLGFEEALIVRTTVRERRGHGAQRRAQLSARAGRKITRYSTHFLLREPWRRRS